MDNLSFAEKRKLFNSKPVMKVGTGTPKVPISNNELSSDKIASELQSRLPSDISQQSMDNDNATISDSTASPSQVPTKTSAFSDLKPFSYVPSKKPPVPLPGSAKLDPNPNTHSEPSSTPQTTNGVPAGKKPPMPLPDWVQSSSNIHGPSESLSTSENIRTISAGKKPPVPPPRQVDPDRLERSPTEFLSISLDSILPLECMFLDCDETIRDHRRRDPRTIVCSRLKAPMPEMNINEKNILQRYSDL